MFVQGFESLVLLFLTCSVVNNPYTFFSSQHTASNI